MRVSDLRPEEEADVSREGEKSREQEARLREREELISALRNFAEHFGAAEVYQEARAIYLESPAGHAEREKEALPGKRARRGSSALEDAKRALGG